MVDVHVALAALAGGLTVGLVATALIGAASGRPLRRWLDRLILAVLAVIAIAVLTGPLLVVTGHRPDDPLHLLYAALAIMVLPVARFIRPTLGPPRQLWVLLAGGVILLGLLVRLLQTG